MGEHVERIEAWKEEVEHNEYSSHEDSYGHGKQHQGGGAWQDCHATPATRLAELYRSARLTDTTIIMPGLHQPLKVHRLVLSMSSSVFEAMLFGTLAEGDAIELPDDPVDAFRWMLNYMYTGEREISSVDLCVQIYQLANKYMVKDLVDLCSQYLLTNVSAVNLPLVFNVATLLNDHKLLKKCMQVFKVSTDAVLTSPDFCELTRESLRELLIGKELHVSSEVLLFNALTTWATSQLEWQEEEVYPASIRQEIEEFLPEVRFLSLTLSDFVKHVLPPDVLTPTESKAIQLNMVEAQEVPLPYMCSTAKENRKKYLDESEMKTCILKDGPDLENIGMHVFDENEYRILISDLRVSKNIYLSKLEYSCNFGHPNAPNRFITVTDDMDDELQTVPFVGRVASFVHPLELLTDNMYTFKLREGVPHNLFKATWSIHENEKMVTGKKHIWNYPAILHFWDM